MSFRNTIGAAVGIDLGTGSSSVGIWKNDRIETVLNDQGQSRTPSSVFNTESAILVGCSEEEMTLRNPANAIIGIKRLIGRDFTESALETELKNLLFVVKRSNNNELLVETQRMFKREIFTPEQILGKILKKMLDIAEAHLGTNVSSVVLSVHSNFTLVQRSSILSACSIAGIHTVRLIKDPTASALAYAVYKTANGTLPHVDDERLVVIDLGAGAFDACLLMLNEGIVEVLGTTGSSRIGGSDFIDLLVSHFIWEFRCIHKVDLRDDPRALSRPRNGCRTAMHELSSKVEVTIEMDSLYSCIDFRLVITRDKFEELCVPFLNKIRASVVSLLEAAKLSVQDVDIVLLT